MDIYNFITVEITIEERNYFKQLDERQQRLYVGLKVKLLGWHGVPLVGIVSSVGRTTLFPWMRVLTIHRASVTLQSKFINN